MNSVRRHRIGKRGYAPFKVYPVPRTVRISFGSPGAATFRTALVKFPSLGLTLKSPTSYNSCLHNNNQNMHSESAGL